MPNRFRPDAPVNGQMFLNFFSGCLVEMLKHTHEINVILKELKITKFDVHSFLTNEKILFANDKFVKE